MYITKIEKTKENRHFQEGNCEFLAAELNKTFGYKVMTLLSFTADPTLSDIEMAKLSYNDSISRWQSLDDMGYIKFSHCFCSFEDNGKTYYVDSLGVTDDINDILKNFQANITRTPVYEKLDNIGEFGGSKHEHILVEFDNAEEIKNYNWSTYYDWAGDKDFYKNTLEERIIPAQEFVQDYKELLTLSREIDKSKGLQNITHSCQVEQNLSSAQEEYFKNSVLRDNAGNLLICDHYYNEDFNTFESNVHGEECLNGCEYLGKGFAFTTGTYNSNFYGDNKHQCYLDIQHPLIIDDLQPLQIIEITDYLREHHPHYGEEHGPIKILSDDIDFDEDFLDLVDFTSKNILHGEWKDYSEQLTEYAKEKGYDAILSCNPNHGRVKELVVFEPNQIKLTSNIYPTRDNNFKDNSKEYMKENFNKIGLKEQVDLASYINKKLKEESKKERANHKDKKKGKEER